MSILADLIARVDEDIYRSSEVRWLGTTDMTDKLYQGARLGLQLAYKNNALYWWDVEPTQLVIANASGVPDDWVLDDTVVNGDYAYWTFAEPVRVIERTYFGYCRSLFWGRGFNLSRSRPMLLIGMVMIDDVQPETALELVHWDIGTPVIDPDDSTENFPEKQLPSYMPEITRFVAAAFQFLSQQILVESPLKPERADIRRAERQNRPLPAGRLVTLRRARVAKANASETIVDWKHRWFVRGHWRKLDERYTYVRPYIKGPETKPLLVAKRGFHVRQ